MHSNKWSSSSPTSRRIHKKHRKGENWFIHTRIVHQIGGPKCTTSTCKWYWAVQILPNSHLFTTRIELNMQMRLSHALELDYTSLEHYTFTRHYGDQLCANAESGYGCNRLVSIQFVGIILLIIRLFCNISFGSQKPKIDNRTYVVDTSYSLTQRKTTCYFDLLFFCIYKN